MDRAPTTKHLADETREMSRNHHSGAMGMCQCGGCKCDCGPVQATGAPLSCTRPIYDFQP